ncbi:MAG TPA: hypothetical protein VHD62_01340 [Opitutaceae bacterium]|nr:hypothetical protein [Opitutaceae bacterium]
MKKILPVFLLGLVLGGAATWLLLARRPAAAPETPAADAPDITPGTAAVTQQLAALGLVTATPTTATVPPEVKGYGRVLDPAPLVTSFADLETARAAASASEKEFGRVQKLYELDGNASAQALETAEAAAQHDRVQLASAQAHLVAAWGATLAGRNDLAALVRALGAGEAALVRIDLVAGTALAQPPTAAHVGPLASDDALRDAELLGRAPSVDPQFQGPGFLALWRTDPLPPGAALRATLSLPGEPAHPLVVPRGAIVRHEGGTFIYVQTAAGGFERRIVTLGAALDDGIVVTEGVGADDKIVVRGAQQLLATELLGSAGGGEDEG